MPETSSRFLIIDYNLNRVDDVRHISTYVRERHGAAVTLIRGAPTPADAGMCDEVIDLDPLRPDFVEAAEELLRPRREEFEAGIVFSDNAVHSGAVLLERLGLAVDDAELAAGAFCKYEYRLGEAGHRRLLSAQRLLVPDFATVDSLQDLHAFAAAHPDGFVVKPAKEGNNRGVVMVRPGDDVEAAFGEVLPYLEGGVVCEEILPWAREFSFDGLGPLSFVTAKISATGRYPVEVAQVLPARLNHVERTTLERTGRQVNWLVGQLEGPFHNEIRLSDDGSRAAVVEPNRRPAGMKIWSLARWVYGIDLYHRWVDVAFGRAADLSLPEPVCQAATVLLGVRTDRLFSPDDVTPGASPFDQAVAATAARHGFGPHELVVKEFAWLSPQRRPLHATARDNADFAAQGCVVLTAPGADMSDIVQTLRRAWLDALDDACPGLDRELPEPLPAVSPAPTTVMEAVR
ncbi:acetyl-CoA carboxylase biotin carboxylase subunit family protein [Streptomyces wuyuanensis]|uniref:ATP-grasp domain-containing protein n=1 Tax=Streptomyces wuyuanensis TaxID=1196353 RepID=UPI00371BD980